MCGRFTITKKVEDIERRFDVRLDRSQFRVSYNVAPSQFHPVIINEDSHTVKFYQWGLIPFWAKDPSIVNRLINARAETIAEKPAFRVDMKKHRCLVIADGFYEWQTVNGSKIPYRVVLKDDSLFTFAGLWDEWKDETGTPVNTFTIITTAANTFMQSIHTRMPVILQQKDESTWLNADVPEALRVLQPYPSELMQMYPVSKAVNSPAHNKPDLIIPVKYS